MYIVLFFFSSRRRHTRCLSDWSSDVCSSDLTVLSLYLFEGYDHEEISEIMNAPAATVRSQYMRAKQKLLKIGRASCRERVKNTVSEAALKKKSQQQQTNMTDQTRNESNEKT